MPPAQDEQPPPPPAPEAQAAPAAAPALPTILVVDDNESNRDALSRRLTRRGYALTVAEDGPEALRLIAERAFDLVLLDVMMPGMNGLEVLERIRQTHSPADLPVVMATANDRSEDIVQALGLGANDYVTKPFDFPVVLARVGTQVALRQSVRHILDLEKRIRERNKELEAANAELLRSAERRQKELEAAARVQAALLPTSLPKTPGLEFAWAYRPCQELAGDSLNVCLFDDGRVGAYVFDVSGHGVGASLLAVAATRLLSAFDPDSILLERATGDNVKRPASPSVVATRLDKRFEFNPDIGQFITLFYAVIDPAARELTYVSAGHPGGIHLSRSGTRPPQVLDASGMPIGLGDTPEQHVVRLEPGDRVYLYTDGVLEAMNAEDHLFGMDRLIKALESGSKSTLQESVASLLEELHRWCGPLPARDDVSVLAFECDWDARAS